MDERPAVRDGEAFLLGRQPILDRHHATVAYELLFRSTNANRADVSDDTAASARVIVQAFAEWGTEALLGPHRGFVNIGHDLLMSDMVELLPKEHVVLELLETIPTDRQVVERCRYLRASGFRLALDDLTAGETSRSPLYPLVDVVKVDLVLTPRQDLQQLVRRFEGKAQLLAEKVDTAEQAEHCHRLGFELFQGYFFARPAVLAHKRTDPSQASLMRLLGLALTDGENDELEAVFREDCKLSYNLIRLVNSVGAGTGGGIRSIGHALMVLGRQPLQRWLQLLLYVDHMGDGGPTPLFTLAATRGKLMETLTASLGGDHEQQDEAFMIGSLSLLDALLGRSMSDIVQELGLAASVRAALTKRAGEMGELLLLVEALERHDTAAADAFLVRHARLSYRSLASAQVAAMNWAESLFAPHPEDISQS